MPVDSETPPAALDETAPDFTPVADGPAASGAVTPDDSFFDSVTFKGGVDPSNNWTAGWTTVEWR